MEDKQGQIKEIENAGTLEELEKAEQAISADNNTDANDAGTNDGNGTDKNNNEGAGEENGGTDADNNNDNDKQNDKNKEPEKEPENNADNGKTLITDELRKKLDIPEKFKYLEDAIAWGREAEKAKNKFDLQRQQALNENAQYKTEIAKLKEQLNAKVKTGEMSKEEKQAAIDKFNELLVEDPIAAFDFLDELKKKRQGAENNTGSSADSSASGNAEAEARKAEFEKKAQDDWDKLTEGMADEEKAQLAMELKAIADEKPYIVKLSDLHDIYRLRKMDEAEKLKKEKTAKQAAKSAAGGIEPDRRTVQRDRVETKIQRAASLKELDELEKQIGG